MKTTFRLSLLLPAICLSLLGHLSMAFADGGEDGNKGSRQAPNDMIVSSEQDSDHSEFKGASSGVFDRLDAGSQKDVKWDGVGSVDRLSLNKEGFSELSTRDGGIRSSTLSLDQKSSYFGFDLGSSGKGSKVDFYNGKTLVGSLNVADLGQDSGFVHFSGDANTSWDKIVLSNTEDGLFDTKNWTSRVEGWNPKIDGEMPGSIKVEIKGGSSSAYVAGSSSFVPATPGAPAPPVTACLAFAGVLLLQAVRRTRVIQ